MAMKSLTLEFTLECSHCSHPLPVNRASTHILCGHCHQEAEVSVELWQALVSKSMNEAANMAPETDTWASGILAGVGTYNLSFGSRSPRCRECDSPWNLEELLALSSGALANFSCSGCEKIWTLRPPPEWFAQVVPDPQLLIGETGAGAEEGRLVGETAVSIQCYHCGGPLPLDGSSKEVKCEHCGNACLVPDDVWLRLHPVEVAHPWYIVVDLGEGLGLLPQEVDEFIDLAGLPDEEVALLWEDDDGACIGRANHQGHLLWAVKEIDCSSSARLFFLPESNRLWVLDSGEELVLCFDASSGERLLRIINDEDDPGLISVEDHQGALVTSDGTILVYREWDDEDYQLRRFDDRGRRIPLWTGQSDAGLEQEMPEWESLLDHPAHPPWGAMMVPGPDGSLYLIETEECRVARYDRGGKLLGVFKAKAKAVSDVEDAAVAGDGSIFIVFDHRKTIGGEDFSHLARIDLDGTFELLAGPRAPVHQQPIGDGVRRISVTARGSIYLGDHDFGNLRALNPDGSTLWRSSETLGEDETRAEELAEARS